MCSAFPLAQRVGLAVTPWQVQSRMRFACREDNEVWDDLRQGSWAEGQEGLSGELHSGAGLALDSLFCFW